MLAVCPGKSKKGTAFTTLQMTLDNSAPFPVVLGGSLWAMEKVVLWGVSETRQCGLHVLGEVMLTSPMSDEVSRERSLWLKGRAFWLRA